MDIIFIALCFVGIWVFSAAAAALRVLKPQQITDLQIKNRLFAGTVSWLANRQNHSIRISKIGNTLLFLLTAFLIAKIALATDALSSTPINIVVVALIIGLQVLIVSFGIGIQRIAMKVGRTSPISSIQGTAFVLKTGYLLLYPVLIISQFLPNVLFD